GSPANCWRVPLKRSAAPERPFGYDVLLTQPSLRQADLLVHASCSSKRKRIGCQTRHSAQHQLLSPLHRPYPWAASSPDSMRGKPVARTPSHHSASARRPSVPQNRPPAVHLQTRTPRGCPHQPKRVLTVAGKIPERTCSRSSANSMIRCSKGERSRHH